jgi:hypothetical protein
MNMSVMNCHYLPITINSPRLKRVFAHWREIRENRLMPAWQDICPAKIKAELPIVWSYRYDAGQDEFLGGLAGDAIQRLLGGPIRNVRFRHLHNADPHFFARAKRVLFGPSIFLGRGLLFRQRERQCYGERIILPFANGDGRAAGIFGATDYKFSLLYESGPEACGEAEQWLDLRGSASTLSVGSAKSARPVMANAS